MPLALSLTLEATSALAVLASLIIVVLALRIAPPGRGPWWRTIAVHAAGTFAFSDAHVMLMTLLRTVVFALAGHHYDFSLSELPYEYRKDLLSYLVIGGIFWLVARERERLAAKREAAGAGETVAAAGPATYDIRDGASILRVPVGEILAARGAGNYVEFALEDGRRPLMRASLAAVEKALGPQGFLRTHRSWLVNAARVRALTAAGSGDFRLDLGCGLTAPLSRRYPAAQARLKGERTSVP
jgi:DNA-binding LytR/AlgR family response regulator